jgi:hypothetical protein
MPPQQIRPDPEQPRLGRASIPVERGRRLDCGAERVRQEILGKIAPHATREVGEQGITVFVVERTDLVHVDAGHRLSLPDF